MIDKKLAKKLMDRVIKIEKAGHATVDDCKSILLDSSQYAESLQKRESCLTLILYRDWLSHLLLDRKCAREIINEIYKQFCMDEREQNTVDRIAELFSSKKLRQELKAIFNTIPCKFTILDSISMWKQFLGCVYSELLHKPIEHPNPEKLLGSSFDIGKYRLPKRIYLDEQEGKIKFVIDIFDVEKNALGEIRVKDADIKVWSWLPLNECKNDFSHP